MDKTITFELLTFEEIPKIAQLGQELNPNLSLEEINSLLIKMFDFNNYYCFGLKSNNQLIGVSSGWITIKLYSGKQLEVDNVIIDKNFQALGYGKKFFSFIESWALKNDCKSIELNTYVQNSKSHRFYFGLGYSILGFHFWKKI